MKRHNGHMHHFYIQNAQKYTLLKRTNIGVATGRHWLSPFDTCNAIISIQFLMTGTLSVYDIPFKINPGSAQLAV